MVDGNDKNPGSPGGTAEGSSSRTQRMPPGLVEPPSSVDISVLDQAGAGDATQPTMSRPRVVVLEERPVGLADALARLGFLVRPAVTGVETMSMCGEHAPLAVVVGPGDAERRRVLTGALRLRFPGIAVVYVLPSPGDAALRDGARGDGVHAVLPWPLPASAQVLAAIPHRTEPQPLSGPLPSVTKVIPPTAALPVRSGGVPELSADESATGSVPMRRPAGIARQASPTQAPTSSPPLETTVPVARPVRKRPLLGLDELATLQVERVALPVTREGAEQAAEEATSPTVRPAAQGSGAPLAELAGLLRTSVPILWSLDDCARFLDDLAAHHVTGAETHARTVRQVARLLAQMQARANDVDPHRDPDR